MKIELNSYDLCIREIKDRDGQEVEVVQLQNRLAFDKDFIEDMREKGVKKLEYRNEEEEQSNTD